MHRGPCRADRYLVAARISVACQRDTGTQRLCPDLLLALRDLRLCIRVRSVWPMHELQSVACPGERGVSSEHGRDCKA
eukprot:3541838-Prymnesium_polylepis.1